MPAGVKPKTLRTVIASREERDVVNRQRWEVCFVQRTTENGHHQINTASVPKTTLEILLLGETGGSANSKHWFTTSFLLPLTYLVTP